MQPLAKELTSLFLSADIAEINVLIWVSKNRKNRTRMEMARISEVYSVTIRCPVAIGVMIRPAREPMINPF